MSGSNRSTMPITNRAGGSISSTGTASNSKWSVMRTRRDERADPAPTDVRAACESPACCQTRCKRIKRSIQALRASNFSAAVAISLMSLFAASAAAETTYVTGDRLLDVERGRYVEAPLITITDGKIVSVESGKSAPDGSEVIDLSGRTILPGLIDMHVHLDGRPEYGGYTSLQFTDRFWTILGAVNGGRMLGAGFTTGRNVGADDYNVAGLDQAIEEGWLEGPRIVNANYALGATGGHCDETYLPPSFNAKSPAVADS